MSKFLKNILIAQFAWNNSKMDAKL